MAHVTDQPTQPNLGAVNGSVRLNNNVFSIEQDGMARILDFERGRFYGLDPVATQLLSLSLDCGTAAAVRTAAANYGVSQDRVRQDLEALLKDLSRKNIVASRRLKPSSPAQRWILRELHRATSYCAALTRQRALRKRPKSGRRTEKLLSGLGRRKVTLLLAFIWIGLRIFGWSRTLRWLHWWHRPDPVLPNSTCPQVVEDVDRLVRDAASRCLLLPMACKERAVAGWQILRACYGLPAAIVVGYQLHPFEGHAWVESVGLSITDDPEHCKMFIPVARYD